MKTIILSIGGMSCSACSNGIEKYLNKQNGIFDAKVNLVMANATITYDEKILDIPKIAGSRVFKIFFVFLKVRPRSQYRNLLEHDLSIDL